MSEADAIKRTKGLPATIESLADDLAALGVVGGLVYGVVGGTIKATQWTGASRGLTAAIYVAPVALLGLQAATAPTEGVKAYEAYRGIACSSKYYDTHEEGPEFDFSASPGGTRFTIKF